MNEYQRLKQLIEKYERPPEDTDCYTEAGIACGLDDDTLDPDEEAFMLGWLAA